MERYSEYKDSGIYYIPLIPSSWNVLKGKILFKEKKRPIRQQDEIVTCFRDGQVTLRKNRRLEGFTNSLKEIGYKGIRKGDLVIHNMDAFAGAIGVSDSDGKGTPVYAVCTPIREDVNQYYYCFLLRFLAKIGFIQSLAKGIRERSTDFRYGDFKELLLPVPSRAEQDAIVRYLDAATSKIDKAIVMQQKMIDLLNERKQIIIQNAVTKGLDENVEMKDSGVEWIGMIPKHWGLYPLRKYLNVNSKRNMPNAQLLSVTREEGVIVRNTESKEENHNFIPDDLSNYKYVRKGQFVINKMKSWQGSYGVSNFNGIVSPAYFVYDLNYPNTTYFSMAIRSKMFSPFFSKYSKGIRIDQWDLVPEALKVIPFLEPPVEEQIEIVEYLGNLIPKIESKISNCQRQIALLQERKQIIINEVVTGKVKVS